MRLVRCYSGCLQNDLGVSLYQLITLPKKLNVTNWWNCRSLDSHFNDESDDQTFCKHTWHSGYCQHLHTKQRFYQIRHTLQSVTVNVQKTEHENVNKNDFYGRVTVICSMLALQNAPMGAFCNASTLHLVITFQGYV